MIRWLVVAVVMMTIAMSCLVDRRSTELECDADSDCNDVEGDRECNAGYCVLISCPGICDGGCKPGKKCTVNCTSPNECRNGVDCPSGFTCTFNCSQDCMPDCPLGCVVNCSGTTADCGPIDCGNGATCSCSGAGTCI
ncbi:MAG: hypothetical protein M4D80_35220 [Myxococcota bacterium]|nr:hypothetical protein [Myxococcota bacterium]